MEISGEEEASLHKQAPVLDEARQSDALRRKYRGEIDILYTMLSIVRRAGEVGIKKTRLLQLSNLNNRSFKKYLALLTESGLVVESHGRYKLTGKGRLALTLLEMLENMLTPPSRARNVASVLCNMARQRGYECRRNVDVIDVVVSDGDVAFGFFFVSCMTSRCVSLLSTMLPSVAPEWAKLVIVNISGRTDSMVKDEGGIITVDAGNLDDESLAEILMEIVANTPKDF